MGEIKLVRDQRLLYRGSEYLVDSWLTGGTGVVMFTPCRSQTATLTSEELRGALASGELAIIKGEKGRSHTEINYSTIDIAALQGTPAGKAMERSYAYVSAFEKARLRTFTEHTLGPIIASVAREIGDGKPPHWVTAWRWNKRYERSGCDIRSLIPGHAYKGSLNPQKPDEVRTIVERCIEENAGGTEHFSIAQIWRTAVDEVSRANEKRPLDDQLPQISEKYVHRVFNELDLYTRAVLRHGVKAAKLKYGPIHGVADPAAPLSVVEIDHTLINLFVVDEKTGLPLGRPWLTVAVDRTTRIIVGVHIGFDAPSYNVVAACLHHAILPKDWVNGTYPQIKYPWKAWGLIKQILVDRGIEFTSGPLRDACRVLNMKIEWTERRKPWHKGKVERFFRTIAEDLFHVVAGAARPLAQRRDEEKPEKRARVTLSGLHLLVYKWIADFYHQKAHRGLGKMSPAAKWDELAKRFAIDPFSSRDSLDVLLGRVVEGVEITNAGIRHRGLRYQSDFLTRLLIRPGAPEFYKIKELEYIDAVAVLDPKEMRYHIVPVAAEFNEYAAGVTWHQHDLISRHARERAKESRVSIEELCAMRAELQQIAETEFRRPTSKGKHLLLPFMNSSNANDNEAFHKSCFGAIQAGPPAARSAVARQKVRTRAKPASTTAHPRPANPRPDAAPEAQPITRPAEPRRPAQTATPAGDTFAEYAQIQNWKVRKS